MPNRNHLLITKKRNKLLRIHRFWKKLFLLCFSCCAYTHDYTNGYLQRKQQMLNYWFHVIYSHNLQLHLLSVPKSHIKLIVIGPLTTATGSNGPNLPPPFHLNGHVECPIHGERVHLHGHIACLIHNVRVPLPRS